MDEGLAKTGPDGILSRGASGIESNSDAPTSSEQCMTGASTENDHRRRNREVISCRRLAFGALSMSCRAPMPVRPVPLQSQQRFRQRQKVVHDTHLKRLYALDAEADRLLDENEALKERWEVETSQ